MAQRRYDSSTWNLQGRSVALTSGTDGKVEFGSKGKLRKEDGANQNVDIWKYSSITKQRKDNNGNISYVPDYDDNAADLYLKFGPNTKYQDEQQNKNTSAKADRGQFGPASSGRLESRLASGVSASARQAAQAALAGNDPTGGAKYFKLASSGHAGVVIGPIVFY